MHVENLNFPKNHFPNQALRLLLVLQIEAALYRCVQLVDVGLEILLKVGLDRFLEGLELGWEWRKMWIIIKGKIINDLVFQLVFFDNIL